MALQSIPSATVEQFAQRAALSNSWSAYVVDHDFAAQAARLEQAFEAAGLQAISTILPADLRSFARNSRLKRESTALILVAKSATTDLWKKMDISRSFLEDRLTILLLTPDSVEPLMRGAPHVVSFIGGAIWKSGADKSDVEAVTAAGKTKTRPASGRGNFAKSASWLRDNRTEYAGLWVALLGDTLIASDQSRLTLQRKLSGNLSLRDVLVVHVEGDS